MYLDNINSPEDLKNLEIAELDVLAEEMRCALIKKTSAVSGHLGPNLGIVETTIALHYVFDSPKDKFVFDVSHQCYPHKMLTGRKDAYLDADHYGTVSGYTNPEESEHDIFNLGHTSTSIGLACGLAKARDLLGRNENIVAIIGDGSLSGGIAYEGLDIAKEIDSNLIIVVNDNQMSIAENHGGLYKHLRELRETEGRSENNFFKSLGLDYHFVENGNNIEALITIFKDVKDSNHPVVVHINTEKGHGYNFATMNKEDWHFRPPFYAETGDFRNHFSGENYDVIVCDYLMKKMKQDPGVATIVAAVPACIGFSEDKRREAGKQFIDVGIAEELGILMASGIARNGGKPIFATHSSFYQRAYDQISQEICINNMPVTMLVRNASVWGMNDVTHLGIFDIPLLSNIPNLVYLAPTNKQEYLAMLDWSIEQNKYPVAIRIPRNGVHVTESAVDIDYSELNKYRVMKEGCKVAIVALGDFFQMGEELAETIESELGFRPTLINPRYITGLDRDLLGALDDRHELVITMEDGILEGGFGEKIAGFYGATDIKVLNYGLKKEFVDRYNVKSLLMENRLTVPQMIEDIKSVLR